MATHVFPFLTAILQGLPQTCQCAPSLRSSFRVSIFCWGQSFGESRPLRTLPLVASLGSWFLGCRALSLTESDSVSVVPSSKMDGAPLSCTSASLLVRLRSANCTPGWSLISTQRNIFAQRGGKFSGCSFPLEASPFVAIQVVHARTSEQRACTSPLQSFHLWIGSEFRR